MIWQESIVHGFIRILKVSDIQAVTNELSKQNIRLLEIVITSSVPTGNILVHYRSGTVNSNTVNSKFHLIRSFFEIFARFLSFQVENARLIRTWLIRSATNSK